LTRHFAQQAKDGPMQRWFADPFLAHERALVTKLMVYYRLPSIYAYREHVVAGD
jgi:hypothetical protein